jgi:hypothetical protein
MQVLFLIIVLCQGVMGPASAFVASHSAFGIPSLENAVSRMKQGVRNFGSKLEAVSMEASMISDIRAAIEAGPIPLAERKYLINGWRWHTLSVLRDLGRFRRVVGDARKLQGEAQTAELRRISSCQQFVCGFNWGALNKIDQTIFFPWLEDLLPPIARPLILDIRHEHSKVEQLAQCMAQESALLVGAVTGIGAGAVGTGVGAGLRRLEDMILQMTSCVQKIQEVQETVFVPYVASYVTVKEQEKFNMKVIRKLGLIDSQVHLVSMLDALRDLPEELQAFQEQIPAVPRLLIPVWRNRLYAPRAGCLDIEH